MASVCSRYMTCLDEGKTERESARLTVSMAEEQGYRNLRELVEQGEALKAGDKVYYMYNEKLIVLYHIGKESMEAGMNILGAHIDSPRMDVKQNPLYENGGFAYLDTHYYGGIKKYQWVTLPLAIHGVVVRKDGSRVNISVGEKDTDPVFTVSDLLIHLSREQLTKTASKVVEGESLDILVGSIPQGAADSEEEKKEKKDTITANICRILKEEYDFEEEDFISAELEVVPAGKARELGFDRSMIIGYGQDDRICAFTSLMAFLDEGETPKRTSCCILVDKEEIGSVGASGMHSRIFENATAEVLHLLGHTDSISLRRVLPCLKRRMRPIWARDRHSTSSPDPAERVIPVMPIRNTLRKFAGCWGMRMFNSRRRKWVRWMPAAAEPSPISWPTTAWKSSTAELPSCACIPRGKFPAKRMSTRPTAATERS